MGQARYRDVGGQRVWSKQELQGMPDIGTGPEVILAIVFFLSRNALQERLFAAVEGPPPEGAPHGKG